MRYIVSYFDGTGAIQTVESSHLEGAFQNANTIFDMDLSVDDIYAVAYDAFGGIVEQVNYLDAYNDWASQQ